MGYWGGPDIQPEGKSMSIEIEVLNGDASWPLAEPLIDAVWPPHVLEKLPWGDVVFAHADLRVLVQSKDQGLVCHVGIFRREVTWNGRKMLAGGIGGGGARPGSPPHRHASISLKPPGPNTPPQS